MHTTKKNTHLCEVEPFVYLITKKYGSLYLKDVGFPLAVDACECSTDGSTNSPNILDEFGVTRKDGLIIQLKEIYTYEEEQALDQCLHQHSKSFKSCSRIVHKVSTNGYSSLILGLCSK